MTRIFSLPILVLSGLMAGTTAMAQDGLTVAYFTEWPMPFQYAKAEGIYDETLGLPVNWVRFDSGTAMSAAMAAGNVQIAISQGVLPFIGAASAGQDLRIVDIALLPEARGAGIGAALLADVIGHAHARGLRTSIHVEQNNPARRLYLRMGFKFEKTASDVYDLLVRHPDGAVQDQ